ncbi:uncharacterized protein MKK02DRAFT_38614 [Dioszegia hungarica]|uniref:Uncharacterized protein n=1 Tax=Dioszegia hungarica TaxID=4972 RepID=A0AA38LSX6_9TREE|nr:uncharacterized protein MKK02DRAFT_38614 [Dioszegia hungarica]KAI9633943.1 hypothetical protein MKK02DRAFT_38614 [Dioszegia hungarica]
MSSCLASSSRTVARAIPSRTAQPILQKRTVLHNARPPRTPILPSPHQPKIRSPTPGTSTPQAHPDSSHPIPPISSSSLADSGLTFHHAPPPSAPSYTTGAVPPFLQWIGGQSVHLTGEEAAPRRKERRGDGKEPKWDQGVKADIIDMRQRGMSRKEIAKSLSLPAHHEQRISRVAPLSPMQQTEKDEALEEQKSTWGFNKRLARAKRDKRRELW